MKALLTAMLVLPTTCALGCIIGWVTTIDGEEKALTCGYMFDHCEVRLLFKDRTELTVSRDPGTRFSSEGEDDSPWYSLWVDEEFEQPLAPELIKVDALLDRGALDEALGQLAKIRPGRAQRAAYHALRLRAFEQKGDFGAARAALEKLLRLDPAYHGHSELLHGFILDAKEQLRAGTLDLARDSVLPSVGLTFQQGSYGPLAPEWRALRSHRIKPFSMFDAILVQLHMQENFYGADRAIIADLYVELGHIAAVQYWLERAVDYYELAIEYGSPKSDRIHATLAHYRQLIASRPHTDEEAYRNMFRAEAGREDGPESSWVADLPILDEPESAPSTSEGASPPAP